MVGDHASAAGHEVAGPGPSTDSGTTAPGVGVGFFLALQRSAGNRAAAAAAAGSHPAGRPLVQRDGPPAGTATAARRDRWLPLVPTTDDAVEIATTSSAELVRLCDRIRPDADFRGSASVFRPTVVFVYFEDHVVAVNRSGQPVVVQAQNVMAAEMTPWRMTFIREVATGHVWEVQANEATNQFRAHSSTRVVGRPIQGVPQGESVLQVYVPGIVLGAAQAESLRRRAGGGRGTAAEAPAWAHSAVDRLRRRRSRRGGGAPDATPGGTGTGGEGTGRGSGNEDRGGTGGGGRSGAEGGVPGGDGREQVDGGRPGTAGSTPAQEGEAPARVPEPAGPGAGGPLGQPLRGPARFALRTSSQGSPELVVTVDRAGGTVPLQEGESDEQLDARIDRAIADLQAQYDPANSSRVQNGAQATGFTPPGRQTSGQAVNAAEANAQSRGTATGATPGERPPGGQSIANTPEYPSHITMGGERLQSPVSTLGATNTFGMQLDYGAMSSGLADSVFNRMQPVNYHWELIDVTGIQRPDERDQRVNRTAVGQGREARSGDARNIGRTLQDVAEDQENDLRMMSEQDWPWEARAAYLSVIGLSNSIRMVGSIISTVVDAATRPLNERSIGFDREGEFVLRCVATPQVSDEARADPDHHVIRASSIAVLPIKIQRVNTRAAEAADSEQRRLAELEAAVRAAATDEDRRRAEAALEAFRGGQRQSGADEFRSLVGNARQQLQVARSLRQKKANGTLESDWLGPEILLEIDLLQSNETVHQRIGRLERQLRQLGGEGAEGETGRGEHERWVDEQAGAFKGRREFRPRVVLASEVNGQVTPVRCMLGEQPNSIDDAPRWRLVDISSPGNRDVYEGSSTTRGIAGHSAALHDTFRAFAQDNSYGRGTIAVRLASDIITAFPGISVEQSFRSAPGAWRRATQRLQDLATAAEIAGLFATGPLGLAIGAVGGVAGAAVAIDSLSRRARTGHVLEVTTIFDVLGVVGGVASLGGLGAGLTRLHVTDLARAGQAAPSWVNRLERTERALHIHGVIGNVQQVIQIPYQLYEQLAAAEAAGGESGEVAARKALAFLQAIRSGTVTIIQMRGGLHGSEDDSGGRPQDGEEGGGPGAQRELPPGANAEQGQQAAEQGGAVPPVVAPPAGEGGATAGSGPAPAHPRGQDVDAVAGGRRPNPADGVDAAALVARAREMAERSRRQSDQVVAEGSATQAGRPDGSSEHASPAGHGQEGGGAPGGPTPTEHGADGPVDPAADRARREALGAISAREGSTPSEAAQQVREAAAANRSAADGDAVRLLQESGDFGSVRRLVDTTHMSPEQAAAVRARVQEARLAVTNEQIARVMESLRARFPDLEFHIQDLGTPGFASDRDITIRVTARDEGAYRNMSEADQAALDRRAIRASAEAVPEMYAALEAAGFPANRSLDTNFYTELHEGRIRPADAAERTAIATDQQIVAMAEIIINAGEPAWREYISRQRGAIDALSSQGTPARDVEALRARLDSQVAAAEARVSRLLGALPQDGHGTGGREAALQAARQRLVAALQHEPPPSARELRQLMADIKLLEPDAYGTRVAVEGVVLGAQAMGSATLDAMSRAGFRTEQQIRNGEGEPGPRRFNERTGQMEEVSAESELARRRSAASEHVGHRRPGDEHLSGYELRARLLAQAEAVLGHLLGHLPPPAEAGVSDTAAAAKNLGRIIAACEDAGLRVPAGVSFGLHEVVASKKSDNPPPSEANDRALRRWAVGQTVQQFARGASLDLSTPAGRRAAFIGFSREQALALVARLRGQTETAALHGGVDVGQQGATGSYEPPRPPGGGDSGPPPARTDDGGPPPTRTGDGGAEGEVPGTQPEDMTATGVGGQALPPPAVGDITQVANGAEYANAITLLESRMGQRTPVVPEPPAPRGEYGPRTSAAALALRTYDEAIARAGIREVGLWFNMNTGEFQTTIGTEGSVPPPRRGEGWVCLQHIHPGTETVLALRLPAPQDMTGFMLAAVRLGEFTTYVESVRPDGSRGRVRVTTRVGSQPAIEIHIPAEGSSPAREPLTFANDEEYRAYWGQRSYYAEPGSSLYNDLIRSADAVLPDATPRSGGMSMTGTGQGDGASGTPPPGGGGGDGAGGAAPRQGGYTAEGVAGEGAGFRQGPLPSSDPEVVHGRGFRRSPGERLTDYGEAMRSQNGPEPVAGGVRRGQPDPAAAHAARNPATAAAEGGSGPYIRDNLLTGSQQTAAVRDLRARGIIDDAGAGLRVHDVDAYVEWLRDAYRQRGDAHLHPDIEEAVRAYLTGGTVPMIGVDPHGGGWSMAGALPGTHAEILAINDLLNADAAGPAHVSVVRAQRDPAHFAACLHCSGILARLPEDVRLRIWSGQVTAAP